MNHIDEDSSTKLIVGLGNPGMEYERTRHNIGFRVIDGLAKSCETKFKRSKLYHYAHLSANGIVVKPMTYMNLSGRAVTSAMYTHSINHDSLVVVYDDVYLPFGTVRIRKTGSDGGHKGVKSIIESIGSSQFIRIKIGIGDISEDSSGYIAKANVDTLLSEYVLSDFSSEEENSLNSLVAYIVELLRTYLADGFEAMINKYSKEKPCSN